MMHGLAIVLGLVSLISLGGASYAAFTGRIAEAQRFIMICGFYGWVALHVGGYIR